ncbi:amino acid ABC transporter substrate-binding protein [Rhizorhabdus histidinilytica]
MRRLAPFVVLAALLAGGCDIGASHKTHGRLTPHTLEAVRARGYVRCGASKEAPGFSGPDESGRWRGLDVDTCRAIAVAALGDREKVRFVPLTGQQRITALQTGEIDVLPRTTTWTLRRDAAGINFTIPTYYDYTAFMVRRKVGVHDLAGLRGASACVQSGSMTEVILADVSRKYRLALRPVIFDNVQSTRQAFLSGRCDALITDASALAALRATLPGRADDYVIVRADSNVAPLTPAVRHGDDQWFDIVNRDRGDDRCRTARHRARQCRPPPRLDRSERPPFPGRRARQWPRARDQRRLRLSDRPPDRQLRRGL